MGKNGQALRAAKANKVYSFTKKELEDHDQQVRIEFKTRCEQELRDIYENQKRGIRDAEQDLRIDMEKRYQDNFFYAYRYFCCKAIPILITHFQFPTYKGSPNKLTRFLEMMIGGEIECPTKEEVEELCEKTNDEYGLYFGMNQEEEE